MKKERSKKLVALDIDQTLAGGVVQAHLRSYNRILGLRMSEQEIMQANTMYRKTFDVPQIIEYRVRHEDRFQAARKDILQSQQVNAELLPIDGSADAVTLLLSTYAHLGYYTVRPPEMLEVTKSWLANHRFPNTEETFITKDHADKIRSVNSAGQALESDPVLIDDSFKDLLEVAFFQNILERLKLVGFGLSKAEARTIAASKDVSMASQVFGIPNWQSDSVEDLKGFIR